MEHKLASDSPRPDHPTIPFRPTYVAIATVADLDSTWINTIYEVAMYKAMFPPAPAPAHETQTYPSTPAMTTGMMQRITSSGRMTPMDATPTPDLAVP